MKKRPAKKRGKAAGKRSLEETAARAKANFRENDPQDEGDVFYVLGLPGQTYVASSSALLRPTFQEFWDESCEFIWVEAQWWCQDRGLDVERAWKSVRPDFFLIGADGVLRPVRTEDVYQDARRAPDRAERRFAWLDRGLGDAALLSALTPRLGSVFGGPSVPLSFDPKDPKRRPPARPT